jgi:hypothetical protein
VYSSKSAAMTPIEEYLQLITLQLIADTGAMLPIGVRKFGCDNIISWMGIQILRILPEASLPLNA